MGSVSKTIDQAEANSAYCYEQPLELASIAALCARCQRIQIQLLPASEHFRLFDKIKRSAFKHYTAVELLQSSPTCCFCALVRDSLALDESLLRSSPDAWIRLRAEKGPRPKDWESNGGASLVSIEPYLEEPRLYYGSSLRLYSPPGTSGVRCVQTGAAANGSAARKFSCSLRRCAFETTSGRLFVAQIKRLGSRLVGYMPHVASSLP